VGRRGREGIEGKGGRRGGRRRGEVHLEIRATRKP